MSEKRISFKDWLVTVGWAADGTLPKSLLSESQDLEAELFLWGEVRLWVLSLSTDWTAPPTLGRGEASALFEGY